MARPVDEWLLSIELTLRFPFLRRMQTMRQPLSERLELVTFLGTSGTPKHYMILRFRGREGRLYYSDNSHFIWFPKPDQSFRAVLQPTGVRKTLGRFRWQWTNDLATLLVLDDMEFHIRRDEARALDRALYGSPES